MISLKYFCLCTGEFEAEIFHLKTFTCRWRNREKDIKGDGVKSLNWCHGCVWANVSKFVKEQSERSQVDQM